MAHEITRVSCGRCKHWWDVYWRDIMDEKSNQCPFCGESIDRTLWERDVFNAAAAAHDANIELEKDATGYNKPRFSVNFLSRKER